MKKQFVFLMIGLAIILSSGCGSKSDPAGEMNKKAQYSKEEKDLAVNKIYELLPKVRIKINENNPRGAQSILEEIIQISFKYDFRKEFIFDMKKYKISTILKQKRFKEALKLAFALDNTAEEFGKRKSPWNYMLIADCYLGMKDHENVLIWMGKAVKERGLINYPYLLGDTFKAVQKDPRFTDLINFIKEKIGMGKPARDFKIKLLDGSLYKLSDRKGKVVLIDFWSTDCPPCVKAFPKLKKLHDKYRRHGFEIIGISLDTEKKELEDFLKEMKPGWMMSCTYDGWKDKTVKQYSINSTPTTMLVDREGIIREYNLNGDALEKAIKDLL